MFDFLGWVLALGLRVLACWVAVAGAVVLMCEAAGREGEGRGVGGAGQGAERWLPGHAEERHDGEIGWSRRLRWCWGEDYNGLELGWIVIVRTMMLLMMGVYLRMGAWTVVVMSSVVADIADRF